MSEPTSITERTRRRVDSILERLREEYGTFEVIVVFDGDYAGGEPSSRDGEIAEVGWFSDPPDHVLYEEVRTRPYPASE